MKERRKILFIITKSTWGGAQQYVFDLATHLDHNVFEVVVALGGEGRLAEELVRAGIRVRKISALQRNISLSKEVLAAVEIFKIIRDEHPDVLHINSSKAGGLGAFLGRVLRVPRIIFTAHGWAFNEDRPSWQRAVIRFLHLFTVLLTHTTIAVSEETRTQMLSPLTRNRMVTIHNGRNTPAFEGRDAAREHLSKIAPKLSAVREDFWSVTLAELHPVKQHEVAVRALAQIVQKHPDVRHVIIGDGEERERLETLIVSEGLTEHVFLLGYIPDASRYLPAFDLFILPSRSEALGYVLIEACAAGLPVVASDVGGIPEILAPDAGILFPSGDASGLSDHYARLYEHPEERTALGAKARERAGAFSLEQMLEKTFAVYSS